MLLFHKQVRVLGSCIEGNAGEWQGKPSHSRSQYAIEDRPFPDLSMEFVEVYSGSSEKRLLAISVKDDLSSVMMFRRRIINSQNFFSH